MKEIWANLRTLPYVIRQILNHSTISAWIAWFPVLFYSTIYVGDLHKKSSPVPTTDDERAELDSEANRLGSRALLYSALLALLVNLIIPLFVAEAAPRPKPGPAATKYSRGTTWWEQIIRVPRGMQVHLATLAEAILTEPATRSTDDNDTASIMLTDTRTQGRRSTERGDEQSAFLPGNVSDDDDENYGNEERWLIEERRRVLSNSGAQMSRVVLQGGGSGDINFGDYEEEENGYEIVRAEDEGTRMGRSRATARSEGGMLSSKAGVILGIHNIFIVIPQLLVTGVSAILFALFDPQKPALPAHRAPVAPAPVVNSTETDTSGVLLVTAGNATAEMVSKGAGILYSVLIRQEGLGEQGEVQHSNSVVHIFR
ncbi:hypothetical protein JR316_0013352 [Psilocybe cubensis]|uniref:Uncharacterized protein n=2 Tax=Psilocybe cubensis TaxID=181762 RepID=A0ACB8GHB3_PSICU|nr:hypothetical protein JR316_0013352 [Psilocybe cubensis]KAH9474884.1 hypothetical protein JR316_0013352 [Psilocybe cubensis]